MWSFIGGLGLKLLVAVLPTTIAGMLGLNKPASTVCDDDVALGGLKNEETHVAQNAAAQAKMDAVPVPDPDSLSAELRRDPGGF